MRAGARIDDALRAHLGGDGHLTRFRRFYDQRYGGHISDIKDAARAMLCDSGRP